MAVEGDKSISTSVPWEISLKGLEGYLEGLRSWHQIALRSTVPRRMSFSQQVSGHAGGERSRYGRV